MCWVELRVPEPSERQPAVSSHIPALLVTPVVGRPSPEHSAPTRHSADVTTNTSQIERTPF